VSLLLVRYCEIGLKSTPVRRRFESILKDNMLTMLAADGVEALISYADARFFIETEDIDKCVESVKKVFGIASFSVAEECTSEMEDICASAANYSEGRISEGQSFAVKARREGNHPYTSMDVGREAGSAIFIRNESLNVKVDLTDPDKLFYIEVRNSKAYIFDSYVQCPGGLPLGSQGRVFADISDERGMVSAWMMMKRGCRTMVRGNYGLDILKSYDPTLRSVTDEEIESGNIKEMLGMVLGTSLEGLSSVDVSKYDVPVYFPTIGMTDDDVHNLFLKISEADFD
jgi:thiamine biosynthesis protein ThiI